MGINRLIADHMIEDCREKDIARHTLYLRSELWEKRVVQLLQNKALLIGTVDMRKICSGLDIAMGEFFSTSDFDALLDTKKGHRPFFI